jgi:VanZ family protein
MPARSRIAYAAAVLFPPAWAGVLGGELGTSGGAPQLWDKALHFIAYFVLSVLMTLALQAPRKMLWGMLGLVAMGGMLEILQGWVGRDMSALDELANSLGVVAGASLAGMALLVGRQASR